ncbi:MAG TPA: thiamine phosphate synthase [Gemmataceae bacterium]|nr:thiamine phosphate synthase [Gemmataceae bacterium]
MKPDLTPAVERALDYARRLARASGADVRPADWLHGLLAEEEGRPAVLAVQAGLDWGAYSRDRPTPPDDPADASIPFQRATRIALSEATAWARMQIVGEATVSGDLLLIALLRADADLRQRMEVMGLRLDRLEAAVLPAPGPPIPVEEGRGGVTPPLLGPTSRIDSLRILDACANRAREGLRVVEDYCRFVLDDAFLSGELKRLRHDLTAALAVLPAQHLLEARETQRDVGVGISTAAEGERASLAAVALANWKRLQEALRSLEEFGKAHGADLGRALEHLRYRSYTLERAAGIGAAARDCLADVRLCVLLTAGHCGGSPEWTVREAAAGGAGMVQLREKELSDRELLERARQVRRWTREADVLFIVNDRPDVARAVEADGVHLGQDDLPVKEARRVLGPDALVGVSTHNIEQLRQAVLDGASYIGVGPTFPSRTKQFHDLAGLDFVRAASAETALPAFVIGGVNLQTVEAAAAAGARRTAVSEAVCRAADPRAAAAALVRVLTGP